MRADRRLGVMLGVALLAGCLVEAAPGPISRVTGPVALELLPDVAAFQRIEFSTLDDIEWASDTELALIDIHEGSVLIDDLSTGERRKVGRSGEGPGELSYPVRQHISGGALLVADSRNQRLSLFDVETGDFAASSRIRGMPLEILGYADSTALIALLDFMGEGGPRIETIDLAADERRELFEVLEADDRLHRLAESGGRFLQTAADSSGLVYAAAGAEYRIVAFDTTGRVVSERGRPDLESRLPTDTEVERFRERLRSSPAPIPDNVIEDAIERFATNPLLFIVKLDVDPRGRLWVRRMSEPTKTSFDVFAASGEFVGSVSVRDRASAIAFRDSLVAVLVERTSGAWQGLESVDVYRVVEADE